MSLNGVNIGCALSRFLQRNLIFCLSIVWCLVIGLYDLFPKDTLFVISELLIFIALALHCEKLFEKITAIMLMGIIYAATFAIVVIAKAFGIPFDFPDLLNAFASLCLLIPFFASLSLPETKQAAMQKYCLNYLILLLGIAAIMPFHNLVAHHTLTTQDALLFNSEKLFGLKLPFVIGGFLHEHDFIRLAVSAIYSSSPVMIILTMLLQHASEKKLRVDILLAFILSGIGSLFYIVVPGVGLAVGLGKNWFEMADSSQAIPLLTQSFPPNFPRNCVPSLHTTTALLFFFASMDFGKILRSVYAVLALGTIIGCLGLGEHYLVDIVMAFPFSIAIWALARKEINLLRRFWFFSVFLILTIIWVPFIPWIVNMGNLALLWGVTILTLIFSMLGFYFIEKPFWNADKKASLATS